jgi:3-hydroxyacyl-CoA dehydrogenase
LNGCPEEIERDVRSYLAEFLENSLERTVVKCPDTLGFIANRIGLFFAIRGAILAMEYGVRPDHADMLLPAHFGVPRLGVFGLFDLVGFEVMNSIAESMRVRLSKADPWQSCELTRETLRGAYGASREAGFRFYRQDGATGDRKGLDLASLEYIPRTDDSIDSKRGARLVAQLACELEACCFKVIESTNVTPDVVDQVMCSGFGWCQGPFSLLKQPASLPSK